MTFSTRTPSLSDLSDNRLRRIELCKARMGIAVTNLSTSNPSRVGLGNPELASWCDQVDARLYRPAPLGIESVREAIARYYYHHHSVSIDPDLVAVASSTSEAYSHLFKLLCNPGDNILVPTPSYPLLDALVTLEGVSQRSYPLRFDGDWNLDLLELESRLDERTRAIVTVNPNNPTGSFLSQREQCALLELCRESNIALISDEVFSEYALGTGSFTPLAWSDEAPLRFSLGGLSKACAAPQLKLSWMLIGGAPGVREEARTRLDYIADAYLTVASPIQLAAPRLLIRADRAQQPIRNRVDANLEIVRSWAASTRAWNPLPVSGGWNIVLRIPAIMSDTSFAERLLEEECVLVHPGDFFGFSRNTSHLVLSLLIPEDTMAAGLAAIDQLVDRIIVEGS